MKYICKRCDRELPLDMTKECKCVTERISIHHPDVIKMRIECAQKNLYFADSALEMLINWNLDLGDKYNP